MRRVVSVAAFAVIAAFGFGVAYVMAASRVGTPGSGEIAICHSGNGKNFEYITPDASGILDGHAQHPDDIIPPFVVIQVGGVTTRYPGQNMSSIYGNGFTGAEVLANNCDIPAGGGITGTTQTITTTITQTVPVTVTAPGTTITLPGTTTTKEITVTVSLPGQTVTAPGTTTVVTLPPAVQTTTVTVSGTTTVLTIPSVQTTTVTLPERTVTLPAGTVTLAGETIEHDPVTITLPAVTQTVVGGTTTRVVTVTQPNKAVEQGGVLAEKATRIVVTTPRRVVTVHAHVIHALGATHGGVAKVVVIVVRPSGCPPGTRLFDGHCAAIVRGSG
jgi:hypothetical protein